MLHRRSVVVLVTCSVAGHASASSFAEGTLVDGSVELRAATRSVLMEGGEGRWVRRQRRLIEADLAQLRPSARARRVGRRHLRWLRSDRVERRARALRHGRARERPCYLEHGFESPLVPRRSAATGSVRMRIAVARPPPDAALAAIRGQLNAVAQGRTPTFAPIEQPLAVPGFVLSAWPWVLLALAALAGFAVLRRRERG